MQRVGKVVIVSQHYPPDSSTTAAIMASISKGLSLEAKVVVLSGTFGSARAASENQIVVVEVRNWRPGKSGLLKRAIAETLFTLRMFFALLLKLRRGDVAVTVPAPFMLPYAFTAAVKLRGAISVLILHDLYPDVLIAAGLLRSQSLLAKVIRCANALMYRALDAVVVIGRDTENLLLRYRGMSQSKIHFIPNWATLKPGVRLITQDNPFRRPLTAPFVVGLSGNLGFTHDPVIVFDAARLLRHDEKIHFLLSGWGVGFEQLKVLQSRAKLPNVTLVERVDDEQLEAFLSAANIWIIPFRKNVAGVSVPSRFYNLLAIGRPIILVSEPNAEAAMTVTEHNVGWIVEPGNAVELAKVVSIAAASEDPRRAERASEVSQSFGYDRAIAAYCELIRELTKRGPKWDYDRSRRLEKR